jgi:uncharacterized protein YggE
VDELLALGGAEFSGIYAGLSKGKAMEDEIWGKALTNARERAEKTLKEMGMKIDSVFAVSPIGFPEIQQEMVGSTGMMMESVAPDVYKRQLVSSQYRLAPVTITQNVHRHLPHLAGEVGTACARHVLFGRVAKGLTLLERVEVI